jgi:hypothetical protein
MLTILLLFIMLSLIYINFKQKNYYILFIYVSLYMPLLLKYLYSYSIQFYTMYLNNRQIKKICQNIRFKTLKDIECNISEECCICLESFKSSEDVVMLPCGCFQTFHEQCIRPWLLKNYSCPSCRFQLSF